MSWWCFCVRLCGYVVFVHVCIGCSDPKWHFLCLSSCKCGDKDPHTHTQTHTQTHTHRHTDTHTHTHYKVAVTDRQTNVVRNWTLAAIDDTQRALSLSARSFIIAIFTSEATTSLLSGFPSLICFQKLYYVFLESAVLPLVVIGLYSLIFLIWWQYCFQILLCEVMINVACVWLRRGNKHAIIWI